MSKIIRTKNNTNINEDNLQKAEFGSKTAIAALNAKPSKKLTTKIHHHTKSLVEEREEITRRIQSTAGTITGVQFKSNAQLTSNKANKNIDNIDTEDPWDDPNEVTRKDDLQTALEKRLAKFQLEEQLPEPVISSQQDSNVNFEQIDSLNQVTQSIRAYSNYNVLVQKPELVIVLAGVSDAVNNLIDKYYQNSQNGYELNDQQLYEIFLSLQKTKAKILCEDELEIDLIIAGAVGILASAQIKLLAEQLNLDTSLIKSLHSKLTGLLQKVCRSDSEHYNLYLRVKEETDLSIVPTDEE